MYKAWIAAVLVSLSAIAIITSTRANHTGCDYQPDMDCSNSVSLADASRLIAHVGEARCPDGVTYATLGNCPTPTATPAGYTVADLLNDSVGNHDIDPCGTGGFDWSEHGVVQSVGPGSRNTAGGWFAYQWNCGANYQSGVVASLRNLKAFTWTGTAWVQYESGVDWCNFVYPPSGPFGADCTLGSGEISWDMPYQIEAGKSWPRSIHGATNFVMYPAGTQCQVTTAEGKVTGTNAVALHLGGDWGNGGQTAGGAVVGRFVLMTSAWRFIGASSCPSSTLTAHPPPGIAP